MIGVLEKPKGWHRMWTPVSTALDPPPAAVLPVPMPPKPLTWEEEVYMACAPINARLDQAWDKCVKSSKVAAGHSLTALAYTIRAVRHADLARQHLTLALMAGTTPWDGIPAVSVN